MGLEGCDLALQGTGLEQVVAAHQLDQLAARLLGHPVPVALGTTAGLGGEQPDPLVAGELLEKLPRPVRGAVVGDDQLEVGEGLGEDRADRRFDVGLVLVRRHHHRHSWRCSAHARTLPDETPVNIVGPVPADVAPPGDEHLVSVVIPVYQPEPQLPSVVAELAALNLSTVSPAGVPFRVAEVLLVHDCGPGDSARVIREMEREHGFARGIWLSRNFGQHAATLAGMASAGGDWIVTLDEDGQHDPAYIGAMLDVALAEQVSVVYARPTNSAPHGAVRNAASRGAKRVVNVLSGGADTSVFHSYRLILGEVGRSVAAYAGSGVYLDIALGWVAGPPATAPVVSRAEGEGRRSGYSTRTLLSHFWRMVLTGG